MLAKLKKSHRKKKKKKRKERPPFLLLLNFPFSRFHVWFMLETLTAKSRTSMCVRLERRKVSGCWVMPGSIEFDIKWHVAFGVTKCRPLTQKRCCGIPIVQLLVRCAVSFSDLKFYLQFAKNGSLLLNVCVWEKLLLLSWLWDNRAFFFLYKNNLDISCQKNNFEKPSSTTILNCVLFFFYSPEIIPFSFDHFLRYIFVTLDLVL